MTSQYISPTASTLITPIAIVLTLLVLSACETPTTSATVEDSALENIYVLRSIREQQTPATDWCVASKTGFEPFSTDAERFFSFWSITTRPEDGQVIDAQQARVAELRACFGPTEEPAHQHFYAEIRLDEIAFHGNGECRALVVNFPEEGLFPVHCHLVLSGLPVPFVGGLLTTNTLTSKARLGGDTEPPGYRQASIATIRLWKENSKR